MICHYNDAYGDKCKFHCIDHRNGFVPLQKIEWWSQGCDYTIEISASENVGLISQWREVNEELRKLKEENLHLTKQLNNLRREQ